MVLSYVRSPSSVTLKNILNKFAPISRNTFVLPLLNQVLFVLFSYLIRKRIIRHAELLSRKIERITSISFKGILENTSSIYPSQELFDGFYDVTDKKYTNLLPTNYTICFALVRPPPSNILNTLFSHKGRET